MISLIDEENNINDIRSIYGLGPAPSIPSQFPDDNLNSIVVPSSKIREISHELLPEVKRILESIPICSEGLSSEGCELEYNESYNPALYYLDLRTKPLDQMRLPLCLQEAERDKFNRQVKHSLKLQKMFGSRDPSGRPKDDYESARKAFKTALKISSDGTSKSPALVNEGELDVPLTSHFIEKSKIKQSLNIDNIKTKSKNVVNSDGSMSIESILLGGAGSEAAMAAAQLLSGPPTQRSPNRKLFNKKVNQNGEIKSEVSSPNVFSPRSPTKQFSNVSSNSMNRLLSGDGTINTTTKSEIEDYDQEIQEIIGVSAAALIRPLIVQKAQFEQENRENKFKMLLQQQIETQNRRLGTLNNKTLILPKLLTSEESMPSSKNNSNTSYSTTRSGSPIVKRRNSIHPQSLRCPWFVSPKHWYSKGGSNALNIPEDMAKYQEGYQIFSEEERQFQANAVGSLPITQEFKKWAKESFPDNREPQMLQRVALQQLDVLHSSSLPHVVESARQLNSKNRRTDRNVGRKSSSNIGGKRVGSAIYGGLGSDTVSIQLKANN